MNRSLIIIAALLFSFAVSGCKKMFVVEPANNPEAIFENLWNTFHEEYAPFDERKVDWQALYSVYRPRVTSSTTESELYSIVTEMLGTLNDGHVSLTTPGREVFVSNKIINERIDDGLFSLPVVRSYLEPGFKEGEGNAFIYGKIKNENLAYIYFDYVADNFLKLNDFLSEYSNVAGYIIDMRHNQGGDFTWSFNEMGRLTDQSRYVFRSKTKNGKGPGDYTDWYEWRIEPGGDYVNKPIVVLTDRYTISAGERAVMAFMTLPNVTMIGDTTSGAHGTMIGRELANGWYYTLVPQKVELYDGKSYEGIGLPPDIYSKNTLSEIGAGKDRTLDRAIGELK